MVKKLSDTGIIETIQSKKKEVGEEEGGSGSKVGLSTYQCGCG